MKTIHKLSIFLILFSFNSVLGQDVVLNKPENNVPIIVAEAFQTEFPKQEPVWYSQYQGRYDTKLVYEAHFAYLNRTSVAIYNRDGGLIAFAATIEKAEIPQKAIEYMNTHYASQSITEALLVTRGKTHSTIELGIYIGNSFTIVVFDKEGNFTKTSRG